MSDNQGENKGIHPYTKSTIDKIIEQHGDSKKREAILAEEIQEYKDVLNQMAASPNGRFVLRKLIRYCGIYQDDDKIDPAKLIEDKGRRSVYLKLIRPYLNADVRQELERESA